MSESLSGTPEFELVRVLLVDDCVLALTRDRDAGDCILLLEDEADLARVVSARDGKVMVDRGDLAPPVATFEPSQRGWDLAVSVARELTGSVSPELFAVWDGREGYEIDHPLVKVLAKRRSSNESN